MLMQASSPPSAADDRESRVRALLKQLRPHVERTARRMAESLADCPDAQLFGELEFALRDQAHNLAAAAHQTGLEGRKKGGYRGCSIACPDWHTGTFKVLFIGNPECPRFPDVALSPRDAAVASLAGA